MHGTVCGMPADQASPFQGHGGGARTQLALPPPQHTPATPTMNARAPALFCSVCLRGPACVQEIGFCHMRVSEGVNSRLQLSGLLAKLCKLKYASAA